MKFIKYIIIGIVFGIALSKAEIVSWYRIYEMFRFESFHMYGVIGSAVMIGIVIVQLIKRKHLKSIEGQEIVINPKTSGFARYFIGGSIFGLGWALTGACPGPMFILLGQGFAVMSVVIFSSIIGTFVYGLVKHKLPH